MPKKQADGRYRTKIVVAEGEKPVWVSGRTLREFEENKRLVRETYIDGVRPREITFHAAVVEWFDTIKKPRIRTLSTLKNYQNVINVHLLPFFPEGQLVRAVRRADLQRCLDKLSGASSSTIVLLLSVMRNVMSYAISEHMLVTDPSAALIAPGSKQSATKDAFSPQQEEKLLSIAAKEPDGLMIYILYYLGCRRGEMLALQWGDFDWTKRMVHIQRLVEFGSKETDKSTHNRTKTESGNRWVPVPDELYEILRPLRSLPNLYLFPYNGNAPLKDTPFRVRWTRLMLAAGYASVSPRYYEKVARWRAQGKPVLNPNLAYDYDCQITTHWFRHNYITACVLAGVPAEVTMRIVGHRDYSTTINIYTHVQSEQKRQAAVSLSGVLRGTSCQKVAGSNNPFVGNR